MSVVVRVPRFGVAPSGAARAGWTLAVLCAGTASGCFFPDTTRPSLGGGAEARVCHADELAAFRQVSQLTERPDLWIAFVDVGQGDAIWIRTPGLAEIESREILIDAGDCAISTGDCGIDPRPTPGEVDGVGALIAFMSESGWPPGSPIDYLVITHPDKDHYGGTWRLARDYRIRNFVDPGMEVDQVTYDIALSAIRSDANTQILRPAEMAGIGENDWGREVDVRLLSSDKDAQKDNDASIVLSVRFRGRQLLLTGDAEESLDLKLVAEWGDQLASNVLKAGHHGGQGTSTQALLDKVFPGAIEDEQRRYAIMSSGRRENLPHATVLTRLIAMVGEAGLYRTDRGDERKSRGQAPGDDHILMRVTAEGDLNVCYAYEDDVAP